MAWNVEEICDRVVDGDETLAMLSRFEALHDALSSSDRPMGVLRPVIQSLVRKVFDDGHDVAFGRAVGSEFVGDHDSRCLTLSLQTLSHQAFGGLRIATILNQHVENEAILIDSSPQSVLLAANEDVDPIEVPFVAKLSS